VIEPKYAVVSRDELDRFPVRTGAPVLMLLRQRLDETRWQALLSDDEPAESRLLLP
jgi:hypothetical protein